MPLTNSQRNKRLLTSQPRLRGDEARSALQDLLSISLNRLRQFSARWDVMNQSSALTQRPHTRIDIASLINTTTTFSRHQMGHVGECDVLLRVFDVVHFQGDLILVQARGVPELAENKNGGVFVAVDDGLLHV